MDVLFPETAVVVEQLFSVLWWVSFLSMRLWVKLWQSKDAERYTLADVLVPLLQLLDKGCDDHPYHCEPWEH